MKILFLNPPFKTEYGRFSRSSRSPAITKSGTLYYPIWLCYAAGAVEEKGFKIKIIDSCAYEYDKEKTLNIVSEFKPDICVIDTSTPSIYNDIEIGVEIKRRIPYCFITLMGTHPTALPEETMNINERIDAVVVGEADYTVKELAEKLDKVDLKKLDEDFSYKNNLLETIDGIAYRAGKNIFINKKRDLIKDLNALPFISKIYKRHFDVKKYFFAASDYPEVQIMTSRGCIAKCSFCVYPQVINNGKYRMRSPENVADEFQWIVENMPEIREIGIEDDTFTGSHKRAEAFCKELIKRKIKIKWYCNVRADLNFETMLSMKRAGCVLIIVGYESADPSILININKRITPDMILQFSYNAHKAGLLVHGCFMVGNRGESKETMNKTFNLALHLKDDTVQFFPLIVYPGTEDYQWAKKHNLLTAKKYSDYLTEEGLHNSVVELPDMTSDEIREWCNYARRKYYLRPQYIMRKMFKLLRNPSEIRRTYKSIKRFARFLSLV